MAFRKERWREGHSLIHDPRLGRSAKLRSKTPFQGANIQPNMHGEDFHAEALLPNNNPEFVRL